MLENVVAAVYSIEPETETLHQIAQITKRDVLDMSVQEAVKQSAALHDGS
ncbi:MAG: hypothetical protein QOC81_985 [Thermoanaerobaculia bacterium]|nr:hypothetical protein [Thermoanaerobaculia bacterium]